MLFFVQVANVFFLELVCFFYDASGSRERNSFPGVFGERKTSYMLGKESLKPRDLVSRQTTK